MPQSERLLLGPGPSNPYPEAVAALTRPVLGHLDPEFLALLDETMERLRSVFRTKNALTLPISGTGSAGEGGAFRHPPRPAAPPPPRPPPGGPPGPPRGPPPLPPPPLPPREARG